MGAVETCCAPCPACEVETIESSCCGMAGAFGYGAATIDVSLAMAELALLPAVRKAGAKDLIVADGMSCRHQIRDGAGREAVHVARVLEAALAYDRARCCVEAQGREFESKSRSVHRRGNRHIGGEWRRITRRANEEFIMDAMVTGTEQAHLELSTDKARWAAVERRDPAADGAFYYSVRTTGVYCRPSCGARPHGARTSASTPRRARGGARRLPRLQALQARPSRRSPSGRRGRGRGCRLIEAAGARPGPRRAGRARPA